MRLKKKFQVKAIDETKGEVTAVIATLNVKDHDGDVTIAGAFGSQEAVIVPAHDWDSVPLGRASISEEGGDVVALMKFNLDIEDGRKWYSAIKFDFKAGNPKQEYSYGYEILDADKGEHKGQRVQFLKKLKVIEVSPVLLGAGIGTGTASVKGRKAYVDVVDSWESVQSAIQEAAAAALNDPYCYIEATLDDSVLLVTMQWDGTRWRENYVQFDWAMADDGTVTLSNRREVQLDAVISEKNRTYANHLTDVAGRLKTFTQRSKALAALRTKDAKEPVSVMNRDRLKQLRDAMSSSLADLDGLLTETPADAPVSSDEAAKALAAFLSVSTKTAAFQRS